MAIRLRLITLVVASTFVLVGCGGGSSDKEKPKADVSGLSATALLAKANKELAAADSVAIEGSAKDEKEGTELAVDMAFAGETASGTVAINGLEFQLLGADGKAFFKASDDFFTSVAGADAPAVIAAIGGRWVVAPADDPNYTDLVSFTDKKAFFEGVLEPEGKVTKGKAKTVDGVKCISLVDSDGGTLYFDKSNGRPISLIASNDSGTLTFSYDDLEEALAPTADEQVDLNELG